MKGSAGLFLLLLLVSSFTSYAANPAIIAVAAEGNEPSVQVSAVAARCPYFLLFDAEGAFLEALANPHRDDRGGVGSQATAFLADQNVSVVVAGAFGPKMVGALQSRGMRHLEFQGTADAAVKHALKK